MRLAVLEAVSAGLCGGRGEEAWLREGLAMWRALVADLCSVDNLQVDTLLDGRWCAQSPTASNLHVWRVDDPAEVIMCWASAVEDADAALIVAPEADDQLARLVAVLPATVTAWNCHVDTTRLCADKFALFEWLQTRGLRTLPTVREDWSRAPNAGEYPLVIKPVDGAGSLLVRLIASRHDWDRVRREYAYAGSPAALRQPFIAGRPISRAGWFNGRGGVDWLPIAEQRLAQDGGFEYRGGSIPAELSSDAATAVQQLTCEVVNALPGLCGYVGMDLLLPAAHQGAPLLVEINPRLTTSYVGYREWWTTSPWTSWLSGTSATADLGPGRGHVWFAADGTVTREGTG